MAGRQDHCPADGGKILLNNDLRRAAPAGEHDRRDSMAPGNRLLGRVVACNGAHATIAATAESGETDLTELWSVGGLISITVGKNRVVALAYSMRTDAPTWGEKEDNGFQIRSEEHTSELQSLMRNSYAVFCLKKK